MILSFKGVKRSPWGNVSAMDTAAAVDGFHCPKQANLLRPNLAQRKWPALSFFFFFAPPFVLAMSQLNDSLKNFKKNLSASTLVGVKRTATARPADHSHTTKHTSINNNTRASFEHAHQESRKKQKKATGSLIGSSGTIAGMMTIVVLL